MRIKGERSKVAGHEVSDDGTRLRRELGKVTHTIVVKGHNLLR